MRAIIRFFVIVFSVLVFSCGKDDPKPVDPVTQSTGDITDITSNSAKVRINLSIAGSVTIDAKGICWSLSPSPTVADNKTNEGAGTASFTSEMTNLTPNTTYQVRSYVTSSGKTSYGTPISVKTLEGISVTLTTAKPTAITSTTATSGGSMIVSGVGSVSAKGVCWSVNQSPTIADSKTSNGSGASTYSSSLTGLVGGTTYFVRAYVTDNNNQTTYGNQESFTTLPPFTVTVTTTTASLVTTTSASTGGSIATTGTGNISSRGVCWSTTATPTISNNKTTNGSGSGTFVSSLTALTPNTTYFVRAYATDNAGNTTYGNELSFKTQEINLNLDGTWKYTSSTNTFTITGSTSSWTQFTPGKIDQAAINQGLLTLTTKPFDNFVKTGNLTWTCNRLSISYTESLFTGVITITKVGYIAGTVTMSADGKSITVKGTVPSGQGWPANLVGTSFTDNCTRQ